MPCDWIGTNMNMDPTPAPSTQDQIEAYQRQIEQLKHRAVLELKVKLAEARSLVVQLQDQIAQYTGEIQEKASKEVKERKTRTSITIEQVVEAIRGGAFNYRTVAAKLGASPQTVMKKIQAEGKNAGITSVGQKAAFRLLVR